ncbi:MAG: DNA primase [Ignavibacteriaceae bacterium]|nr:DNA primase [Ignavibacteriaceae bacterium]
MRISENKIEEIRSAADIVDLISEFVQLRKRGKNFIGLCPFHNEKTPSFTVSEDKQIFHCFGCHTGGNVFKFLMEYEKISFIEAVQEIAARVGINLEYEDDKTGKESEQEILYEINVLAARYFSDNLLNSPEGEAARKYFHERKIKPQTMRSFGLGYALNGWENFVEFAKSQKIDLEKAISLGLIGQQKDGRLFDKFSDRIIFPIFSANGRVIAFAGRVLENRESAAKYLNSPESSIYFKGRILYGLSFSKDEIRKVDKAILVEGYMDLISLYQNGIKNVVAVSGTALTEDQVQLLSRYTKNVVLLFDADTAGIKASMRSIELLLKQDMEVKIAALPSGEDPDSYINKFGKDDFYELIQKAQNFIEYQTSYFENQHYFKEHTKTAEAIRELVKLLSLIGDELKRNLLLKSIAKQFNLREKLLETELDKIIKTQSKQDSRRLQVKDGKPNKDKSTLSFSALENKSDPGFIFEKELVKLLYEGNEAIIKLIFSHFTPEDFKYSYHQKLTSEVFEAFQNNDELSASYLIARIKDEELQSYLMEITFEKYSISRTWDELNHELEDDKQLFKFAVDTIKNFKLIKMEELIAQNHERIEQAESEDEKINLMKEKLELQKELKKIKEQFSQGNLY